MLRHFYKMAPFLHGGHTYPLPPNQCFSFDPQAFLLLQTTLIRG